MKGSKIEKTFNKVIARNGLKDKLYAHSNVSNRRLLQMRNRFESENADALRLARQEQADLRRKSFLRKQTEKSKLLTWSNLLKGRCVKCNRKLKEDSNSLGMPIMKCPKNDCVFSIRISKLETVKKNIITKMNEEK